MIQIEITFKTTKTYLNNKNKLELKVKIENIKKINFKKKHNSILMIQNIQNQYTLNGSWPNWH